jgi:regulator of sirC expression with transglutaminase-like and TPR domain
VSHRQLLARMLANLKGIYWQREAWDRVVGVIDRLLVLDPKAGEEWRDRGLAWTNMGELQRGLGDWERYLTEFPNATDHEAVKGQLRKTRQKLAQLN